MEYRNLGKSGLKVSRLVLGGAQLGGALSQQETTALVHAAWDVGVSTFYTADDYNEGDGERFLGTALRPRRDDVVLIIKGGYRVGAFTNYSRGGSPADGSEEYSLQNLGTIDHARLWSAGVAPTSRGLTRKHLTAALDASLRRLGTDYIDVYCAHYYDTETPVEETLETLDGFVKAGKVRYLGCSQHRPWQLYRALWASDKLGLARYEYEQVIFSILQRNALQNELPALRDAGVSILAAVPDAGGMVMGAYDQTSERPINHPYIGSFWNDGAFDAMEQLKSCAASLGRPVGEMALAWVLGQEPVAALLCRNHDAGEFVTQVGAVERPLSAEERAVVDKTLASLPINLRTTAGGSE
jgi:1-deoxyxylulose-5-phosphate synthase